MMDTKESNKHDSKTENSPTLPDLELSNSESEEIKGAIGGGTIDVYFHVIRNDSNAKA